MVACLAIVGVLVPVLLICVGVVFLILNALGLLVGLLWPALPILIGLAILWRWLKGGR